MRSAGTLIFAVLILLQGCGSTQSTSVTTRWEPPTKNEDGSRLENLAGYRLYWGRVSGGPYTSSVDIPEASTTSYVIDGLTDGEWYIAITAVSGRGKESVLSEELAVSIVDGAVRGDALQVTSAN